MTVVDGQRKETALPAAAEAPLVSVVIVCMNNMANLRRCLPGLKAHTSVSFETLVVAYRFTPENLAAARAEFPWAVFVESDEIRGFSENNNLALRRARGKYCFVLNDDTELRMPAIDRLVEDFGCLPPEAAIVSPKLLNSNGSVQACGRGARTAAAWFCSMLHIRLPADKRWVDREGLFRTCNVVGAAFLAKTEVFREAGWFDERYFFCPEDIALSTALHRAGYGCFVDSDATVIHHSGMSGRSSNPLQAALRPAGREGALLFYSGGKPWLYRCMKVFSFASTLLQFAFHAAKGFGTPRPNADSVAAAGDLHILRSTFTRMTPKELFVKFQGEIHMRESAE